MAAPWEKYGGTSSQSVPHPMTVGAPSPMKLRDQQLQEEANRRAEEANQRAAEASRRAAEEANKPKLPAGYRMGPNGVAELIPGIPGADGKPKAEPKPLPATAAAGIQANMESLRSLDAAINALKARPQSIGPGTGALGDTFTQFNDPEGTDVRSGVGKIGALTIHDLSGAAVSATEAPRFQPFVPTVTDRPEIAQKKLEQFRAALQSQIKEALDYYSPTNGYMPYQTPQAQQFLQGVDGEKPTGNRLTPEQQAQWEALLATKPTKEQIDAWWTTNAGAAPSNSREVADALGAGAALNSGVDYSQADASREAELRQELSRNPANQSDAETLLTQGATLGLSDEAAGVGRAMSRALQGQNPIEGYRLGRDAARLRIDDARQNMGGAGTALEIGGGFASGNVNALAQLPTLGGRMLQGIKAGAAGGGVAGFGYGEGLNSLLSAVFGAAGGATLGGAIPLAGEFVGNQVRNAKRLVGRDSDLSRRLIGQAIEADGNTPTAVGQAMDSARGRGSPLGIADTGENTRALLGSVTRQQGGSKALGKQAVIERQNAQAERISEAVLRDLGPTANISELGEALVEEARNASRPLYQQFESAKGASVVQLDDLAARPAFQRALKKSVDLSREEGVDPTALGFRFNDAGEMALDRDAISWKAMDYVKRALDDVIEASKDQRGKLNEAGRAALGTKKTLVARMDKVNPAYAKAREAYAGPVAMRDAVEKGVKALNKSPDNIMAEMKHMGQGEMEGYRLGVRKAIVDMVNSKRDGGDKVAHLLGTPKSRAVLSRVFGGKQEFERFIATLRDEEAMGLTYKAVATGSPTAERMATDATTNDAGLAESAFDAVLRGGQQGLGAAAIAGIQRLRDVGRFGAGQAGERTRESIAALLTETDPQALREIIAASQRALSKQRTLAGRRGRNAVRTGRGSGNVLGMGAGRLTDQDPK